MAYAFAAAVADFQPVKIPRKWRTEVERSILLLTFETDLDLHGLYFSKQRDRAHYTDLPAEPRAFERGRPAGEKQHGASTWVVVNQNSSWSQQFAHVDN